MRLLRSYLQFRVAAVAAAVLVLVAAGLGSMLGASGTGAVVVGAFAAVAVVLAALGVWGLSR